MHTMELFLMVEPISVAKPAVTTALSGSPPKALGFVGGYLLNNPVICANFLNVWLKIDRGTLCSDASAHR
jgi:hypothetical protein